MVAPLHSTHFSSQPHNIVWVWVMHFDDEVERSHNPIRKFYCLSCKDIPKRPETNPIPVMIKNIAQFS